MSGLSIRTRAGVFPADLDDSDISNAIWLSLPLELSTNMLGGMAYCECPLSAILPKEGRVTELETGDIAYWPGPGALCFFFGPTPLSGEDGRPVSPYPVIRIGRIIGDCSEMENMGDRQRIVLESDYRSRVCFRAVSAADPAVRTDMLVLHGLRKPSRPGCLHQDAGTLQIPGPILIPWLLYTATGAG